MIGEQDHSGDAVRQLLAAISERADAATTGPWAFNPSIHGDPFVSMAAFPQTRRIAVWTSPDDYGRADAQFIVASRQDVPRLVAALTAVLDLATKYRHGALRWADPLPVPEWVDRVEAAIALELRREDTP